VIRYEYAQLGDLLHLDIKKLGPFSKSVRRVTGDREVSSEPPRRSGRLFCLSQAP